MINSVENYKKLVEYAENNDIDSIENLIMKGFDIVPYISKLLQIAADKGHLEILKHFSLPDYNKKNKIKGEIYHQRAKQQQVNSLFENCCMQGNIKIVNFYLEIEGKYKTEEISYISKREGLELAVSYGHIEIVKSLLKKMCHKSEMYYDEYNHEPKQSRDILELATDNDRTEIVHYLLKDIYSEYDIFNIQHALNYCGNIEVSLDTLKEFNNYRLNYSEVLKECISSKDKDKVQYILRNKIKDEDICGDILYRIIQSGDVESIKDLFNIMSNYKNKKFINEIENILEVAVNNNRLEVVKFFLEAKLPWYQRPITNFLALGNNRKIKFILSPRIKIAINTQVSNAAESNDIPMVEYLIQQGADINNAIKVSASNNHVELTEILVDKYNANILLAKQHGVKDVQYWANSKHLKEKLNTELKINQDIPIKRKKI